MERDALRNAPQPGEKRPRRRKGLITMVAERYPAARAVQNLIGYEPGGSRRAAFRTMAKMGVRAVPALLAEMEDKVADERGLAAQLFRKMVESHPHTDWDRALLAGGRGG